VTGRGASGAAAAVRHLLWSLAVALLVLALCEGGLRLAGFYGVTPARPPTWMDGETYELWQRSTEALGVDLSDVTDLEGWRWDPVTRWALKPNVDIAARNIFLDPARADTVWRLTTNSRGYRTPEFDDTASDGRLRVLVLGDSNSMGWLLDDEDAYPRRLEGHLEDLLHSPVEVINLAVGGYTSFSVKDLFFREALDLDPDALVISCGANDGQMMSTSDADYASGPPPSPNGLAGRLGRLRLTALLRRLLPSGEERLVPRVDPESYGANLDAVGAAARARGIPVVFLKVCCCKEGYNEKLDEAARRHGIPVVTAEEGMSVAMAQPEVRQKYSSLIGEIDGWYSLEEKKADFSLLFYFRDQCHLNPLGAELTAAALAGSLAAELGKGAAP
jgi:lysophospholipase L1-like esterase